MDRKDCDQATIRQYLLSQLTDEKQQEFEKRLLVDSDLFEELEVTEAELIDDFVAGKMTASDRNQFEAHFLAIPARQEDLRFAKALNRYVSKHPSKSFSPQEPIPVWKSYTWAFRAAAAVAVVVIVVGLLLLYRNRSSPPRTFATLTLTSSRLTRGEGIQSEKIRLPLNADGLRVTLLLPEPTDSGTIARAELLKDDGEIQTLPIASQDARSVTVDIPAAKLERANYNLRLYEKAAGSEQRMNANYFLTVQ
jgi:hypothetical protein